MAEKEKQEKKTKKKKKKSGSMQIFLIVGLAMGVVFLPTTFLLSISMLPSLVALIVDRSKRKTKAITVGAMNLAGATPFLLELWMSGNDFEKAFSVVTDPKAIIVIYSSAAIGYLIDWSMTGIVASVLVQRGHARKKAIVKHQKELVDRWGEEVKGELVLDEYGFRVHDPVEDE